MNTNLTVTVDGQPVPLDECGWLERRPCGCIVSALVAVSGSRVIATAEQAHAHLNRTKRDRERAAKAGLTTELITMRHYREHIGANWECEAHRPLTAAELKAAQADVDHLNAEFPDEPQDGNGWPGDEHAEPGTRGWTV